MHRAQRHSLGRPRGTVQTVHLHQELLDQENPARTFVNLRLRVQDQQLVGVAAQSHEERSSDSCRNFQIPRRNAMLHLSASCQSRRTSRQQRPHYFC